MVLTLKGDRKPSQLENLWCHIKMWIAVLRWVKLVLTECAQDQRTFFQLNCASLCTIYFRLTLMQLQEPRYVVVPLNFISD
jgi:hypothetical protein